MHPLDRVPAIRRIETDRDDAYAFEITGEVTAADAENFYGLLEGAYELHDTIDLLVRIVDLETIDWHEVSQETRRACREHARKRIRRAAAVGVMGWTRLTGSFVDDMLPSDLKHFAPEEEDEAWAYLEARPIED